MRLNEGQALLGEQLVQVDNVIIKVPNFLADKKSIFKEKFPSAPKAISAPKHKGLCVLIQNPPSESIPSKRTRKLPRRWVWWILNTYYLKFMFSKKATRIEKNLHHRFDTYLVNVKLTGKIWSIFVAFLENINFISVNTYWHGLRTLNEAFFSSKSQTFWTRADNLCR